MTERLMTFLAFLIFLGFLAILVWRVPQLDIGGVVLLTVVLAGYDLFFHRTGQRRS